MIELTTLGSVGLRSGPAEFKAVLQQPKRLTLLAYLAVAKRAKLVRRDILLALFWPDLDQEHARAALRRSLSFLRQHCGTDLLIGRGDEEVGTDPGLISSDAAAFDDAITANRLEPALNLYRGDFLEGFYVQGAPDAEAWIDRERTRRRYEAALAAWQLARNHLADLPTSGRWAERAIGLAPQDQDAALAFLLQLERRGERGLTERLFAVVRERLATDLGTDLDDRLVELADRIRAVSPRPSPPVPRDEWLVAICPFAIRSEANLGYLSEGMVDLLATKLDGTGALRTLDPRVVVERTRRNVLGGTDAEAGAAVAEQLGAGLFLIGTLLESGGRIEAGIGLYHADGRLKVRAEARADTEAGLFDLVDELVRRLIGDMDQSPAGRLTRLAALTTASLPALKGYLHGEHEFRLGRHLQALDFFRKAALEDPSFALAYYRLASSLAANALIGPAQQASSAAFAHRDRLSDHDRLLLEAQHAWLHGRTADAERRYAALAVAFPEQLDPWYLLGDLLFHTNPYRGRSVVEARDPFERALQIDPTHLGALTQLARIAALEGRRDELRQLADRALAHSPSADQAIGLRVLVAYTGDDEAKRRAVTDELARAPGLAIARAFADVALYARDLDGALAMGYAILPSAKSPEFEALGNLMLAHLELAKGRPSHALDRLRLAARHEPAAALQVRAFFASLPSSGLSEQERQAAEADLEAWDPSTAPPSRALPLAFHDGLHGHLRWFLLGLLAGRRQDAVRVVATAESLSELLVPGGAEVQVEHWARTLDALALRLQGRGPDALSQLERLKTEVWFQYAVGSPFFAGSYQRFLRAELLAESGRFEEARGWWQTIAQRSPYELILATPAAERVALLPR